MDVEVEERTMENIPMKEQIGEKQMSRQEKEEDEAVLKKWLKLAAKVSSIEGFWEKINS